MQNQNNITLYLTCPAGTSHFLADEVHGITGLTGHNLLTENSGVIAKTNWDTMMQLNLKTRIAQRVLIELKSAPCETENHLYQIASKIEWEKWFHNHQTFRIDITAKNCPWQSLNFAALRIKDAIADRFRDKTGSRPSVDTHNPQIRINAHIENGQANIYIDTSGEPLFKRGWRTQTGDAPLKETLAAAMLAAAGWWKPADKTITNQPLYDPCCGSGTLIIEAATIALGIPAGAKRKFGFEQLIPHGTNQNAQKYREYKNQAPQPLIPEEEIQIFGSDISHRMADFAQKNAQNAGVDHITKIRGGDALERMPPTQKQGIILMNPPYGERIAAAGFAGQNAHQRHQTKQMRENFIRQENTQESAQEDSGKQFFQKLSSHWKSHYAGWTAWLLSPDMKLPSHLRLKESKRTPLYNGPIECRLFKFDITARKQTN